MKTFTLSRHIDAPVDNVFRLASDFRNAAGIIRGITRVEMCDEAPVAVGTRFKETRVIMRREAAEEMEVTEFDPPRSFALQAESCGCRFHTRFCFTPAGEGTEVRVELQATPLSLFARAVSFLMRPMVKMCLAETGKDLDDLKAAAEQGRDATGAAVSPA